MMNTIAALLLFFWVVQYRQVLSDNILDGNILRLQCITCECTTCTKSFVDAYPESEMGLTNDQMSTNKPDTYFYLFTRNNSNIAECMHCCPGILPNNTRYNWKEKTIFIVHGFIQSACNTDWMRVLKDQFLIRGNYNVVLVDWAWGNGPQNYTEAVKNVKIVALQIAYLVKNIANQTNTSPNNTHIIGHSLGAQVAGLAGKRIPGLGRITGLDPAGPGYLDALPENRLFRTDAQFVDVLHTNAGNGNDLNIGYPGPCGDADFYPNGGSLQLSCISQTVIEILQRNFFQALLAFYPPFCSHLQAIYFYNASINSKCCCIGYKADSYQSFKSGQIGNGTAVMGFDSKPKNDQAVDQPNIYYLNTTLTYPFCQ